MGDEYEDMAHRVTLSTMAGDAADAGATPTDASSLSGQIDEFQIVKPLGQGGMGRVYLAYDTFLDRFVAIKQVLEPAPTRLQRFKNEARTAARLQHPNIVTIHRIGEHDGQPFIVEEYVRGPCLDELEKPIAWPDALSLGIALSSGLAAAHRARVLHRDIKPGNVIIAESGELGKSKLVDFGLAKVIETGGDHHADVPGVRGAMSATPGPLTQDGAILGTPSYIAPELWRARPASPASDVYSMGVLLYELCAGQLPHHEWRGEELRRRVIEHDAPALQDVSPEVDRRFAEIVNRCLAREPARRFPSAEALWDALIALDARRRPSAQLDGSPYPGLRAFEAEDRGYFFGRDPDIRKVWERLRSEPFVLVAGESGVGKSSLCRAGVLPLAGGTEVGDGAAWSTCRVVPGQRPLAALGAALGPLARMDEAAVASALDSDAVAVGRRWRQHSDNGRLLVFIDQLEELVTISDSDEASAFCQVVSDMIARVPGLHVLATIRGDKVAALASMPGLGERVERSLYLLRPLRETDVREVVVRPAYAHDVRFVPERMVDALCAATVRAKGGLPLLQFALSQLWEARDTDNKVIREHALDAIGGVEGALSRHADSILAAMLSETHEAARQIFLRLATHHDTQARQDEDALVGGDPIRRKALDALIDGRLVVAGRADGYAGYELAHEALLSHWGTLRRWLDEQGGLRAVKQKLAAAAQEWVSLERSRDALWRGSQLRAAEGLALDELSADEAGFLQASRRATSRARWLRRVVAIALVVVPVLVYVGVQYAQLQQRMAKADEMIDKANGYLTTAEAAAEQFTASRERALRHFEDGDSTSGEQAWAEALVLLSAVESAYEEADTWLVQAFVTAPEHDAIKGQLVDMLDARARLAEELWRDRQRDSLVARMDVYDGERAEPWKANVSVTLETEPSGLSAQIEGKDGERQTPTSWSLEPGTYMLVVAQGQDTPEVRYPFRVPPRRVLDESALTLTVDVPARRDVFPGFAYVAPGSFLSGMGTGEREEIARKWLQATPLHQRHTAAYLIAKHEVTYEDWIAFLNTVEPSQRAQYLPDAQDQSISARVALRSSGDEYELLYEPERGQSHVARTGQNIEYPGRKSRESQDWLRFPVTGISGRAAQAYATWLSDSGKVPGARLCREDEWERAARGADGRMYSHGDSLAPADANHDFTYGRRPGKFGFDEVGSYSASISPFGLHDTTGNAREITISIRRPNWLSVRGGSYYQGPRTQALANQELMEYSQRNPWFGLRICADAP